jgi:hypothetical protein
MELADLVAREGYRLEIDANAADRPDALGLPQKDELCAQACRDNVVAIRPSVPEPFRVYPVSHEIAEDRCGFTGHHQALWREQLAILCRWVRILLTENAKLKAENKSLQEVLDRRP